MENSKVSALMSTTFRGRQCLMCVVLQRYYSSTIWKFWFRWNGKMQNGTESKEILDDWTKNRNYKMHSLMVFWHCSWKATIAFINQLDDDNGRVLVQVFFSYLFSPLFLVTFEFQSFNLKLCFVVESVFFSNALLQLTLFNLQNNFYSPFFSSQLWIRNLKFLEFSKF